MEDRHIIIENVDLLHRPFLSNFSQDQLNSIKLKRKTNAMFGVLDGLLKYF